MHLEGSCCCKAVTFSVESPHPYPFMCCYCSICRKSQGGGGFAINIGAFYETLSIRGEENIASFNPIYSNHETGVRAVSYTHLRAHETYITISYCVVWV